jgi:hypothetical protein
MALSHRRPTYAETSHDSYRGEGHKDKGNFVVALINHADLNSPNIRSSQLCTLSKDSVENTSGDPETFKS